MTSDVHAADDTEVCANVARIEALMNEKASAIFQLCDLENKGFTLYHFFLFNHCNLFVMITITLSLFQQATNLRKINRRYKATMS